MSCYGQKDKKIQVSFKINIKNLSTALCSIEM